MEYLRGVRVIRTRGRRTGSLATVIKDSIPGEAVYICFDDPREELETNWCCSYNSIEHALPSSLDGYDMD